MNTGLKIKKSICEVDAFLKLNGVLIFLSIQSIPGVRPLCFKIIIELYRSQAFFTLKNSFTALIVLVQIFVPSARQFSNAFNSFCI